jgi:hypothetical protein
MRKLLMIISTLLMAAGLTFGQAAKSESKGHAKSAPAGGVKEAIKHMEQEIREGNLKGDAGAQEKYLAEDFHTISGANGQAYTKQQVIDRLKNGATKFSQINVSNDDVAMYGNDLAISHGVADVKYTMDGKEINGKFHYARTWQKRGGKWQAVWFQTTPMQ